MAPNTNLALIQNSIDELLAKLRKTLEENLLNTTVTNVNENIQYLVQEAATTYFLQDNIGLISVFDQVNSAICVTNAEGGFVYVNQCFANICGYTKSEILKSHFTFLLSKKQQPIVLEKYIQFFENGFIIMKQKMQP